MLKSYYNNYYVTGVAYKVTINNTSTASPVVITIATMNED